MNIGSSAVFSDLIQCIIFPPCAYLILLFLLTIPCNQLLFDAFQGHLTVLKTYQISANVFQYMKDRLVIFHESKI